MPSANGLVTEIRMEAGGLAAIIDYPAGLRPSAGQYLAAVGPDPAHVLPVILYPTSLPGQAQRFGPPIPPGWFAGFSLTLRGPLGNGFHLPPTARRVLLAAYESSAELLLPLAGLALAQAASVTLCAANPPDGLPTDVEVLPLSQLPDALVWADYLGLALPNENIADFRRLAGFTSNQRLPIPAEALILAPMPCAGMGACQVCAVSTSRGWKLACQDGPVYPLSHLEPA
jgi:hypothetical protein